jgi:hypothetical protein
VSRTTIKLTAPKSVLKKLQAGDRIRLTEADFVRLSKAFFVEIEARFANDGSQRA